MNLSAEDEVRLSPFEDDKLKDTENTAFQAGSDYSLSAKCQRMGVESLNEGFALVRYKLNKLEFVGLFEDEFCTSALHSPQGEGGPPTGGG